MGIKTLVLGIGNLLLMDEGVGIHAVNALRERYQFPGGVTLLDGGTMGLDLLPYVEGMDRLLILDAADMGAKPGTIRVIEGDGLRPVLDTKFSVHQIGVREMLFAAEFSGSAPPVICLAGIQPERIGTGIGLSGALAGRLSEYMAAIIEKLRSWGINIEEAPHVSGNTVQDR